MNRREFLAGLFAAPIAAVVVAEEIRAEPKPIDNPNIESIAAISSDSPVLDGYCPQCECWVETTSCWSINGKSRMWVHVLGPRRIHTWHD